MTAVPTPTLGPDGFTAPAESAIRAGVFTDMNASFGGNLNPASSEPQGQWSDSLAAVIGFTNDLFLLFTNQVDPAFAQGRMQDAIARIYYLTRNGPLPTVVTATVSGASTTPIPAGSLAQAADGTIYEALSLITIPLAGTIDAQWAATVDGPIACPAGALNRPLTVIPGWDSITNAADGALGRNVETRADFEARRGLSVSGNATGILGAVRGAVLSVADVLDAYVTENSTGGSVAIGTVTLPPHSLYVAVVGGTDEDVARAIWTKKNPGCDYYGGNTTVTVEDREDYSIPYPSYDVVFERPAALPIFYNVEIAASSGVPSDAEAQVKAAIIAAHNGVAPSGASEATKALYAASRVRVGQTIFASRFVCPVAALGPWAFVSSLQVGLTSPGAADTVTVQIDETPTVTEADITVSFV